MPRMSNVLTIWMNGQRVGQWSNTTSRAQVFTYDPTWHASAEARPLSLSMPFVAGNRPFRGGVVEAYFDNLLPDSDAIRKRIAERLRATGTDAFSLLREIGRDCVGAIQVLPEGETPTDVFSIQARPLDDDGVARALKSAAGVAALGQRNDDDFRISLAGAQEKTALLRDGDRWCMPLGSTPTTHIFKLPLGRVGNMSADMSGSVENEWLCSKILEDFGIPVAHCDMGIFDKQKALIVERFDRRLADDGSWWVRLPQEDMCQALGISPLRKYEADGGPGMADIFQLLDGSTQAQEDRRQFFRALVLFWMLAAPDGHAKNFSLRIDAGGRYRMTPLYDVLSAWPVSGRGPHQFDYRKLKMAMAVRTTNAHYKFYEVRRRHWKALAARHGMGAQADGLLDDMATRANNVADRVGRLLPGGFPERIATAIFKGLRESATILASG
jgi:serine/threonine-protein kinase HipA